MKIKNFNQLASSPERKQALLIAEAGLQALDTTKLTQQNFDYDAQRDTITINKTKYPLAGFKRVVVVGAGKVVAQAAQVIEQKLGDRLSAGVIIDIVPIELQVIKARLGTHPLPSRANLEATAEIIELVSDCTEDDFVIALIGGGGSSLLVSPSQISLEQERQIFNALLESGADIQEMNTVRKHMSSIKGGGLAKYAYPAKVVSLIFSDVPGDDLQYVASGPTMRDTTTVLDADHILSKYQILKLCDMDSCGLEESPKESKYFARVDNILFANSKIALQAMKAKAKDLGFNVKVWSEAFNQEARLLGPELIRSVRSGECLLAAGESTVVVNSTQKHRGSGGRNQELALAAAVEINDSTVLAAIASDGHDNSDVAGAIVDVQTTQKAGKLGYDVAEALANHDEYQLLLDTESSIITGITGSNVSDLLVCLKY